MAKVVIMPKLGLTMQEGTVAKWLKAEGEKVSAGEVLFEVSTDKLTNEIQADADGILRKQIVSEGTTVPCQAPVGIIADADEDISSLL